MFEESIQNHTFMIIPNLPIAHSAFIYHTLYTNHYLNKDDNKSMIDMGESDVKTSAPKLSFQDIILTLHKFWSEHDCLILQPYDMEMGAGTFHPATALYSLGPEPWRAAYVQPCRRPTDGRYGQHPNRLQQYYQYQVILKPSPHNSQALYLDSLREIGLDRDQHDIRFVEDDWESPTLGAWGLGWEVWCDGMEVSQFTYFQQMGGINCEPVSVELTYGLERLAMYIQGVDSVYDVHFNSSSEFSKTYGDLFQDAERGYSYYNFIGSDVEQLRQHFDDIAQQCNEFATVSLKLKRDQADARPAFDQCIKASHLFNLLDARGVLGTTERVHYIAQIRNLANKCCQLWLKEQCG